MPRKLLITLSGNDIAPRFDLVTEVVIVTLSDAGERLNEKVIILPQASPEQLCHLVLTEHVDSVICGGIEEQYFQYLTWKRVRVLDSVIGPYLEAVRRFAAGVLQAGAILRTSKEGS